MSAFHAYDIRGVWGKDVTADLGWRVGRCLPSLLGADHVLVGRDARTHSPKLAESLIRGLLEAGADVDDAGLCTTPTTYFLAGEKGYGAAAMVTASHNPKEYNGIKISRAGALPVGGDSGLKQLEAMTRAELPPAAAKPGTYRTIDPKPELLKWFGSRAPDLTGLRFVVDCSNGVGALLARDLFAGCGGEASFINETLDGTFPNHPPNPLLPEASAQLGAEVVRAGADLGMMFDGDADRVAFVDSRGRFVRPDVLTAVLAEKFLAEEPGAPVLCDIRTSRGVTERVAALGGKPVLWKVGHAFAKPKLRELKAPCGGELAGHYYFREFHGCDSAMRAAQIVLGAAAAAKRAGSSFDALVRAIDIYANSGEVNFACSRKEEALAAFGRWAASLSPERTLDFDGIRCDWPDGWANVRQSNTEAWLRLVLEARTPALLREKRAAVEAVLAPYLDTPEKEDQAQKPAAEIRPARFSDARAIYALVKDNSDTLIVRSLGNVLEHLDRFLVADAGDGRIVGALAYGLWPEIGDETRTSAELQSVCVAHDWRRLGIGKRLVEAQLARLRELGVWQAVVLTYAVDFFSGLGFRETDKRAVMYKLYTGCINCTKHENPFTCPEKAMVLPL